MKRANKRSGRSLILLWVCMVVLYCAACKLPGQERVRLMDLDFTILGEEVIPAELADLIAEKKQQEFKFTYSDREYLYICIGYGEQQSGGYSIVVNDLYQTQSAIYVNTQLLGPKAGEKNNRVPSYPYVVIQTPYQDETVIFE